MLYRITRTLLFLLPPEAAHCLVLHSLKCLNKFGLLKYCIQQQPRNESKSVQIMGLKFDNRVGLAAGFDKNGEFIDECFALGFGFVEVGTVTPRPQSGQLKPRLFRLIKSQALINRMGFNNKGVDYLCKQIQKSNRQGILGVNIGKNKHTTLSGAYHDYVYCFEKVYLYADYVVINISSPNTQGLRKLQAGDELSELLAIMKNRQKTLTELHNKYVPLALKISPDVTSMQIQEIARQVKNHKIDGIIVTNTTLSRDTVDSSENKTLRNETGGLSGKPLFDLSNRVIKEFSIALKSSCIPIIGVGGISSPDMALTKIQQGASLVQLYTGMIYHGPKLVNDVVKKISR